MSAVREILERLSGIHVVSEKLDMTMERVEKLGDWLLDHERRLVAMETSQALSKQPARLPRKKKK